MFMILGTRGILALYILRFWELQILDVSKTICVKSKLLGFLIPRSVSSRRINNSQIF